ncbi:hypothetical protein CAL12_20535 [Bordetella genomosp. 8]|uniref:Uncharacterized protein n=1 Tax=Bordetella genomosp. 8 TaxID=1416806 RepID=A0A1W6YPC9_9BORD|nr:hypothetical protein CAL12_20535 [Bordetella genomosp. 8]
MFDNSVLWRASLFQSDRHEIGIEMWEGVVSDQMCSDVENAVFDGKFFNAIILAAQLLPFSQTMILRWSKRA